MYLQLRLSLSSAPPSLPSIASSIIRKSLILPKQLTSHEDPDQDTGPAMGYVLQSWVINHDLLHDTTAGSSVNTLGAVPCVLFS